MYSPLTGVTVTALEIWYCESESEMFASEKPALLRQALTLVALVGILSWLLPAAARADDWSLTTADLQMQTALPRKLSADGLTFSGGDGKADKTIPLDRFVSLQRSASDEVPTPSFTLVLSNGDRLVGAPGPVVGQRLTWVSPLLGNLTLPFNRLVVMSRGFNFSIPDEPPKQDVVTLANGDSVAGVFMGVADQKLTIQADTGAVAVPLENIRRIAFAPTAAPTVAAADNTRAFRVRLNDGTLFTVADAQLDAEQFKVTLKGKNAVVVNLPMNAVLAVEQLNGPLSWLSSIVPTQSVQTPYFSGGQNWPARFDCAVDGSPLTFDGRIYDHGIGVHAYSKLVFPIDGQWAAFRTQYAIDSRRDQPRRWADVTVRILLDDKLVHEEKQVRQGVISNAVLLELKGARTVTLECDYGDAGDTQGHLNWLQPALLRGMPATSASTQPSTQP